MSSGFLSYFAMWKAVSLGHETARSCFEERAFASLAGLLRPARKRF
jgi:hypothetical protein